LLRELGAEEAISGMAVGVDQCFFRAALDAMVPVAAYVPFVGQDGKWPEFARAEFRRLLALASRTVVVSPGAYSPEKFLVRNDAMVRDCDVLVAVWRPDRTERSGTYHCLQSALRSGRPVVHVDPFAQTVTLVA
jgi:uncharacterized phage-like protein YoqJ